MQGPAVSSQEDATPVSSSLLKRVYISAIGETGAIGAEPSRGGYRPPDPKDGNNSDCGTLRSCRFPLEGKVDSRGRESNGNVDVVKGSVATSSSLLFPR